MTEVPLIANREGRENSGWPLGVRFATSLKRVPSLNSHLCAKAPT